MGITNSSMRRIVRIPADGAELEGALEMPVHPRGVVIFAHGSGSSRMSPRNRFVAISLRRVGFVTLLFDLLTESEDVERARRFDIALLAERLRAAVLWAQRQGAMAHLPIGLFGASTGAAAAIETAASGVAPIAAVVCRGGRPDLASEEALALLSAPTLLIVGGEDHEVIALNESAWKRMRCPKVLRIVPGATHLFEEAGALESVAALAATWFTEHLRPQPRGMENASFLSGAFEGR